MVNKYFTVFREAKTNGSLPNNNVTTNKWIPKLIQIAIFYHFYLWASQNGLFIGANYIYSVTSAVNCDLTTDLSKNMFTRPVNKKTRVNRNHACTSQNYLPYPLKMVRCRCLAVTQYSRRIRFENDLVGVAKLEAVQNYVYIVTPA